MAPVFDLWVIGVGVGLGVVVGVVVTGVELTEVVAAVSLCQALLEHSIIFVNLP